MHGSTVVWVVAWLWVVVAGGDLLMRLAHHNLIRIEVVDVSRRGLVLAGLHVVAVVWRYLGLLGHVVLLSDQMGIHALSGVGWHVRHGARQWTAGIVSRLAVAAVRTRSIARLGQRICHGAHVVGGLRRPTAVSMWLCHVELGREHMLGWVELRLVLRVGDTARAGIRMIDGRGSRELRAVRRSAVSRLGRVIVR